MNFNIYLTLHKKINMKSIIELNIKTRNLKFPEENKIEILALFR